MNLRRSTGAIAGLAVVAAVVSASPAGATDPPPAAAGPGRLSTVTLLTGDQVRVVDGKVAGIRMAPGREAQPVWQYDMNGHQYVLPADAAPLVEQDRLDRRLFDITELVDQGLDDAATRTVPLIVQGAAAPRATERTATVPARGLTVVEAPKDGAAWRDMRTARAAGKIWLNGRVRPLLEDSVPRIGAPEAWAAGFTGTGAKVAVLDSGYDANHPDLAGIVDAAQDFTDESIADTVGHGTHVASTIAGSGAASDGRRTGVAPGARLLIGKVLGEFGGSEAGIIAGMQWAVDQGADVVNMSLGGGPSDGTDLMSQTLNELSDTSGTLFVVAAGNSGARETVGSPGTADRALTVGSVTKGDQLSEFSSQGPRVGDHGLKPEIAAPGSDIVAARAAGTNPGTSVDEHYTRMSGTSMATPHVAGAAAVLAGQHPDWTGAQLKDALVGSAKRLPGIDTYAQGAGRLDIARGVAQRVRVEGVLGFGTTWAGDADTVERRIGYVNDGDTPVTLDLSLETDSDLFTVDSPEVTVPAHGNAAVTVTLRVPDEAAGEPSGALVATADGVTLTTPVSAYLPGTAHTLTVNVQPREVTPVTSLLVVQDTRTGKARGGVFFDGETATFTVPAGDYRVLGRAMDFTAATDTLFAEGTRVADDTELVVDTKRGKEITAAVDDPDARWQSGGGTAVLSEVAGTGASVARTSNVSRREKLYSIGSPRMSGVSLVHFGYWTQPFATITVDGQDGFEVEDTYVAPYPRLSGTVSGEIAYVGHGDREAIDAAGDVRGKIAVIAATGPDDPVYPPEQQLQDAIALLAERGATLVLSNYNPQYSDPNPPDLPLPVVMVFNADDLQEMTARLADGPVTVTATGRRNAEASYFLADKVNGRVPDGHRFQFARKNLGAIDRDLVDTLPAKKYRYLPANWSFGGFTAGADVEVDWPRRGTDYVSPGAALTMFGSAGFTDDGYGFGNEVAIPMTVKRGEREHVRMFGAPFGPELTTAPTSRQDGKPVPYAYRQNNRLTLSIPMFADNDPANAGMFDTTNTGTTVVTANGREVGRRDDIAGLGTFDLPAGPGTFTVVADADRPAASSLEPALSTHTRAEWTFRAPAGTGERAALPFLDVRWSLPLDAHNRASTGTLRGGLTVATQPGTKASRIRSLTVEVSYDDGQTWKKATVTHNGDRFEVRIPGGGTPGGYASLRATATDKAGNKVTETVTHAYALR
ncbi:S8 family serine peptidase [Actinophytocola algeriensis]|uniref:Subtilisin family serine protease n=1 Tax=Actinophytocola algeriensis TaxID=1768010 RepID=A0A7W7Q2C8_9PSEU|nr:S8 family serine peptidase [Actinophytocola algeriensis]MBB4905618.1 subtilisin family serine protease [Actinophytocola algeriensis]MBE1472697.1 subtilisin family serine protease [Actinophytocola algeriensis]